MLACRNLVIVIYSLNEIALYTSTDLHLMPSLACFQTCEGFPDPSPLADSVACYCVVYREWSSPAALVPAAAPGLGS